jgi:hypothetical protein
MGNEEIDTETRILLSFIERRPHLVRDMDLQRVNWQKVLRRASTNRILYAFAIAVLRAPNIPKPSQLIKNLTLIVAGAENYLSKLEATLKVVCRYFSETNIPFLIVKTRRDLPYVTLDVDVLVTPNDFPKAGTMLRLAGAKLTTDERKSECSAWLPGLLRIDLHKGFFWQGSSYLDSFLPWEDLRSQDICNVRCPTPSLDIEVLLAIAHTIGERLHIPYLEFLFIKNASRSVNWETIADQAARYRWHKSLVRFASIVNMLHRRLYPSEQEPLITLRDSKLDISSLQVRTRVGMPYLYPVSYAIETFLERWNPTKPTDLLFDLGYYLFAKVRFHCSGKLRVPIYRDWFDFDQLEWD